ncbi:MAG: EAL domain-containing protein [Clostridiales bacterium]|nr:EAL domain-containing protein [Clostridiales bacterium]
MHIHVMTNAELLLEYFSKLSKVGVFYDDSDPKLIESIATQLKIAYVDFYETDSSTSLMVKIKSIRQVFYDSGKPRSEECVIKSNPRPIGGESIFRIFPPKGVVWTAEERRNAETLAGIMSLCKSRVRLSDRLNYMSFHEVTSGLNNMLYGKRTILSAIERGTVTGYASMFLNMRSMNEVNNTFGFEVGTMLMFRYAGMFKDLIREDEGEAFWRLGGDNYCAFVHKSNLDKVEELIRGVDIRFGPNPEEHCVLSATAGIFSVDDTNLTVNDILDAPQQCLGIARYVKHVQILHYDNEIVKLNEHAKRVEAHFDEALEGDQFAAYYQPKVNLLYNKLIGAEALCRWVRDGQIIPPDAFIPVLERSRKICELDYAMLNRVCRDLKEWMDEGKTVVPVSVNFSRKHLTNLNLAEDICAIVDKIGVPHEYIVIEFTETTTEADQQRLHDVVMALKNSGIKTSIDDFGVGYSSMSMLRDIPFNEIKIDRSFLITDADNEVFLRKMIMMKHIVGLSQELGMTCIAEGAETVDQVDLLFKNGCTRVQGYFFDKPMPVQAFGARLDNPRYEQEHSGCRMKKKKAETPS